ncbi:hypothetical protein Pla175_43150 [Pirellulimonas nuda]|uniref:Uncharacterized protein n=1 Tax=Pirellulimonas nuda TaxID=2528009 RepID=A0A518DHI2_9BACT|nr:hypothetical protein Pla175_43150 [Pirellulimonas nuda]
MSGNENGRASRPGFWSQPPSCAVVYWVCVVVVFLLTTAFWPTVIMLALGSVFACCVLARRKQAVTRPMPRRRVQRRR